MAFDLKEYPDVNAVMVCRSREEAREFEQVLASAGRKWRNGSPYTEENHEETMDFNGGCIFFFNQGCFTSDPERIYKPGGASVILYWSEVRDAKREPLLSFEDMITQFQNA